jgi:hypothetical protein
LKSSSSIGGGDDAIDRRALMKLGFGGTGGFDLPSNEPELRRRGIGSCGDEGVRSDCCRLGGGSGATFFADGRETGICGAVTLIQSGSLVGSNGFLGRLGLSCHPSPGGFGISTLDAAL